MQPNQFPVTSWRMMESWDKDQMERLDEWSDLGFTLIMSAKVTNDPHTHKGAKRLLEMCAERNMQVLLCDERTIIKGGDFVKPDEPVDLDENYHEKAANVLEEFGGYPALWGLYVKDEPLVGTLPAVARACRIIRELSDTIEPYVNYLPNHRIDPQGTSATIEKQVGFSDFRAYLDHVVAETQATMLSYDQYCAASPEWGGADHWFRCLADYQAASIKHQICFWNTILCNGHWMYRAPSPLEMSWQFYNSLAYGAQGIMYFVYRGGGIGSYGAAVDELGNRGPLYYQLQRQHHQFMTDWAWRYRDCRPVRTSHWPYAPAGLKQFDGSGVVATIKESPSTTCRETSPSHLVVGEFIDSKGRQYAMIANGSTEKHVHATITIHEQTLYLIEGFEKESPVHGTPRQPATIHPFIMPGQAIFFRVE